MKKEMKITGVQDKSRNVDMGNTISDRQYKDTKTTKRHKGLPNAGGVRTGQTKNND